MTKTIKPALIEQTINEGRQDVIARRILKLGEFKVRLTVRSDAYRGQCYARAEVWNPSALSWNVVHNLHPEEMTTREGLWYLPNKRGLSADNFIIDFNRLLDMTKKIIL